MENKNRIIKFNSTKLVEGKKKKKPYSSFTVTTGDIDYNIRQFNKRMGTDFPGNDNNNPSTEEAKAQKAAEDAAKAVGTVSAASPDGGISVDTGIGGESSGVSESIVVEDTAYVTRQDKEYEFPPQVKLLPQKDVEKFILDLDVEEQFRVGYITPLELYTAVSDYFELFKATEITGYTGIDYRDAENVTSDTHDARVATAKAQIANQDNLQKNIDGTLHGHQLDNNTTFSTNYRAGAANKLGVNKDINTYTNKDNQTIELNRILFYIDQNNANIKNKYFAKLYNKNTNTWTDWFEKDRETMEQTVFNGIVSQIAYKRVGLEDKDLKVLKKLGLTPEEYEDKYPGLAIKDFVYCQQQGFDPNEWAKEHPLSKRWGLADLKRRLHNLLFVEDEKTIASSDLSGQNGLDRLNGYGKNATDLNKPNVRALYTNQVYYISGRPGTFGKQFAESLDLTEAKRYVRRYYIKPQNIFCSNKSDIIKALIDIEDQDCTIYTLNNLGDVKDVTKLSTNDVIYYYEDGILYDKNWVRVMDYDLYIKHEEERDKIDPERVSDAKFGEIYDDRLTDLSNDGQDDVKENLKNKQESNVLKEDLTVEEKNAANKRVVTDFLAKYNLPDEAILGLEVFGQMSDGDLEDTSRYNIDFDWYGAIQDLRGQYSKAEDYSKDIEDDWYNFRDNLYFDICEDDESIGAFIRSLLPEKIAGNVWNTIESYFSEANYEDDDDYYGFGEDDEYYDDIDESLNESQSQEIGSSYRKLSKKYNIDLDELVYGENGFMKTCYPEGFPDFKGDVIYSKKYWTEFEKWLKDTKGIILESSNNTSNYKNEFDLEFESFNVYGENLTEAKNKEICCICGEPIEGYGNNPEPYKSEGRCCDSCNAKFVIPARLAQLNNEEK